MNELDRSFSDTYLPTKDDILRTRLQTTGIIQTDFQVEQAKFRMYDVGGQRGERKKWIRCFDAVTAILFLASLAEYDQVLAEDRTKNRLDESLALFESIVNLPWFEKTAVILFLNKHDIFMEKVKKVDIGAYFADYSGGLSYKHAIDFITGKFKEKNEDKDKKLYIHTTTATNTDNFKFVWKSVSFLFCLSFVLFLFCSLLSSLPSTCPFDSFSLG
jgi:guanine nucleotide-binding protein subunit alpha